MSLMAFDCNKINGNTRQAEKYYTAEMWPSMGKHNNNNNNRTASANKRVSEKERWKQIKEY